LQSVYGPFAKLELPLVFGWLERGEGSPQRATLPAVESFRPARETSFS